MAATKVNINGINELDLNLAGTVTATTAAGVTTINQTGVGVLELETNGTPNGSQTLLNLKGGSGVTLTDDGLGDVTVASTFSGSAAGGDLSGTYPNPSVTKVNGGSLPLNASVVGTNVSGQIVTFANPATSIAVQQEAYTYAADGGSANAYAVTLFPTPTIVAGSAVCFKAANTNTGASTLAVNGGSATAILKNGNSSPLAAGDITAGQIIDATFDGTVWQMIVPGSGASAVTSLTTIGSSGAASLSGNTLNIPIYAGGSGAFPYQVRQFSTVSSGGSNVTSYTVTFPSALAPSGYTAFCLVSGDGSSTLTIPAGWTSDFNQQQSLYSRLVLCHIASAGQTSATFTVGSASSFSVFFFELVGTRTLDQVLSSGVGDTNTITLPAITPSNGSAIFGAAAFVTTASGSAVPTFPSPFNLPSPYALWSGVGTYATASGGRGLSVIVGQFPGIASSTTPPPITNTLGLYSGGGVAYATFSIK